MTDWALPAGSSRLRRSSHAAGVAVAIAVALPALLLAGIIPGPFVLAGVVALALGLYALISPVFATILLLAAMFLRLPMKSEITLPVEAFLLAFGALAVATVLWMDRTTDRVRGIGAVEWAMAAYLLWNIYSMLDSHEYPAVDPLTNQPFSVARFIVIATVIPFVLYVVGRYTFDRTSAVRALLWALLAGAAYSAAVSILPFIGLSDLVWPRYIVNIERASWVGRAVGIFNQPVVNGMVLALGVAVAVLLMSRRSEPAWQRCVAFAVAVACGCGLYLTHTRAAWLGGAGVLVIGALLAKGKRFGYIAVLYALLTMVLLNWSTFTSADRNAGGVASENEVESRLNDIQTALWAASQKPIEGWGIGRFQTVNTHHHQQWSRDIPWNIGYGEVSHQNEMGILAELGAIGLAAWICVLAAIAYRLWKAYKTLPADDLCGKPLAIVAIMAMVVLVSAGLTVDLRYFDYSVAVIFLIFGITVGWADRHENVASSKSNDLSGRVRQRTGDRRLEALHREVSR